MDYMPHMLMQFKISRPFRNEMETSFKPKLVPSREEAAVALLYLLQVDCVQVAGRMDFLGPLPPAVRTRVEDGFRLRGHFREVEIGVFVFLGL
jgi:hypothetical protein